MVAQQEGARAKRTTVQADEGLLLELKHLAPRQRKSVSHVIREALAVYVAERREALPVPCFVGAGEGQRKDVAERAEELLFEEEREAARQRWMGN